MSVGFDASAAKTSSGTPPQTSAPLAMAAALELHVTLDGAVMFICANAGLQAGLLLWSINTSRECELQGAGRQRPWPGTCRWVRQWCVPQR